jgi:hypothetical protein
MSPSNESVIDHIAQLLNFSLLIKILRGENNNQHARGASKAGDHWQEIVNNHTTMIASDNKWKEGVADNEGSDKEGKSGKGGGNGDEGGGQQRGRGCKGHGIGNKGGLQQRGQWHWQKERWQQGW